MLDFNTLWQGKWVSIVSPKEHPYECLYENDIVCVIPMDKQTGKVGVRSEFCPPYLIKDETGEDLYYTLVTGVVEDKENVKDAAFRELKEESGADIKQVEVIDLPALPIFKNLAMRLNIFVMKISDMEIDEAVGDGTDYESKSKTLWLSPEEIKDIVLNKENYDILFLLLYFMLESGE